jgi:signal transduction histidine kinase
MGLGRMFELGSSNLFNVKVGIRVVRYTWVTGLFFTIVISWLVWNYDRGCDPWKLGTWVLISLANIATRVALAYSWKIAHASGEDFSEFSDRLFVGALGSGLVWGLAGFLFFPGLNETGKQLFAFSFFLLTINAVPPLHSSIVCYGLFSLALWIPAISIANEDRERVLLSVLSSGTTAFGLYFCKLLRDAFHSLDETRNIESEKARRLDRENTQRRLFFLAANHDLGQPLTTIQYELRKIREAAKNNGVLRSPVVTIDESINTLHRLIQDIIQYEKVSAGIVQPERKVVPIHQIFTLVVNHTSHLASAKNLGLWARPTNKQVLSDPFILERIIRNLVENALRYTKSGRVVMATRRRAGRTCVEVWDSGVGISPEDAEHIFDIHFRADATRDMHGGSGLGLSIVQRLSDSIGAEICKPVSIPGRGTVFRLIFPEWSQVDDLYMPYRQDEVRARPPSVFRRSIVVVDDDVALGSAIEDDLHEAGAHPVLYRSSEEAYQALASSDQNVDVLLTDWQLIGETGADVYNKIARIERFSKRPPLWMVISGNIDHVIATELRAKGVVVLMKPFEPAALLDHLSLLTQNLSSSTV